MAKRNVQCIKPSDPPFLRKMKEQCGYNKTTIETKKQMLQVDPDADKDNDDELPQVVVLKTGDLTREQADKIFEAEQQNAQNDEGSKSDSKMVFSTKHKSSSATEASESKKKKLQDDLKKKSAVKAVKNNRLLSFGEDGEDEDE